MSTTALEGPRSRPQNLPYTWSPRLFLSELLLKQWFEPVIPFTVMILLAAYFSLTIKDYGSLANALSLISGEAATGGQQGAFQLMTQFLGTMLDPFVDGRGGAGGPAMGFAPEREELPDDIALAYAKALRQRPQSQQPQSFDQRWSSWGSAFGGTISINGNAAALDASAR